MHISRNEIAMNPGWASALRLNGWGVVKVTASWYLFTEPQKQHAKRYR